VEPDGLSGRFIGKLKATAGKVFLDKRSARIRAGVPERERSPRRRPARLLSVAARLVPGLMRYLSSASARAGWSARILWPKMAVEPF
jgi:hypothetical protein